MWYDNPAVDRGIWWWAVAHRSGEEGHPHPAFYLRALMAGDFAPGEMPLHRHLLGLDGKALDEDKRPRCGTCNEVPRVIDLVPIERSTGNRRALDVFRTRRVKWPKKTNENGCWLCGSPSARDDEAIDRRPLRGRRRLLCARCRILADRGGTDQWLG